MGWKQIVYRMLGETLGEEVRKHNLAAKLRRGKLDHSEKELELIPRLLPAGGVALDIGANIGVYTRHFSRVLGPDGSVHAFEPVPGTYAMLVHNRRYLPHNNVVTYNAAVGDRVGLCQMELPDIGLTSIYRARIGDGAAPSAIAVPMVTIDSLYAKAFSRIDFIKCDVEGAELLVFQGGATAIERERPTVICEIGDGCAHFQYAPEDLFAWFEARGYRAVYYNGTELIHCDGTTSANSNANYLFLHPQRTPARP